MLSTRIKPNRPVSRVSDPTDPPVAEVVVPLDDDPGGATVVGHQVASIEYRHSGPLPSPADMEHYERALPGAADRILAMAEQASAHRQQMGERRMGVIERAAPMVGRGVLFIAVLVVVCVTGLAALLIARDFVWAGASVVLAELLSALIAVIVSAARSRHDQRKEPERDDETTEHR